MPCCCCSLQPLIFADQASGEFFCPEGETPPDYCGCDPCSSVVIPGFSGSFFLSCDACASATGPTSECTCDSDPISSRSYQVDNGGPGSSSCACGLTKGQYYIEV